MRDNYWTRRRWSRRRLLGSGAALGAGAAGFALVGCGDDDDDGGNGSGIATATPLAGATATPTPTNPFANAKRGGTYVVPIAGDPPTLDPYGNLSFLTKGRAATVYSRLFMYQMAPGVRYGEASPGGDLAEKAELSPDAMSCTVTLRSNAKFHNVAPVNGRAVTSDDVKFSWERLTAPTTQNRSQVAFVDKVEYPDAKTIKFTMKEPRAPFLEDLSDTNLLMVMPRESDGGFDPTKTMIGSGPWQFDSYQPSVKFTFKKNPNWHFSGFPLFDTYEVPVIPEYANRKAQFLTGSLDAVDVSSEDLEEVKKAVSDVNFEGVTGSLSFLYFSGQDPNALWVKDPRVRQAASMALDRDGLLEVGYSIKKTKQLGLDVSTSWHNILPVHHARWWVDPKDSSAKGMGAAAKNFKFDPAEAKKLLAAAGAEGLQMTYQYTANRYGKAFNDIGEAQIGMLTDVGFKLTTEVQDYSSKYITQTFTGNFSGLAYGYETPFPEAGSYLIRWFTEDPLNHSKVNDPELTSLAKKQATITKYEDRKAAIADFQRKHGEKMYYIPTVAGAGTGFTGHKGNIKNYDWSVLGYGAPTEVYPFRWRA